VVVFDHLIGAYDQRLPNLQAEDPRRGSIDHEIEFGRRTTLALKSPQRLITI
jgi:hypothetical protein